MGAGIYYPFDKFFLAMVRKNGYVQTVNILGAKIMYDFGDDETLLEMLKNPVAITFSAAIMAVSIYSYFSFNGHDIFYQSGQKAYSYNSDQTCHQKKPCSYNHLSLN
jgi:hypothetical protein